MPKRPDKIDGYVVFKLGIGSQWPGRQTCGDDGHNGQGGKGFLHVHSPGISSVPVSGADVHEPPWFNCL